MEIYLFMNFYALGIITAFLILWIVIVYYSYQLEKRAEARAVEIHEQQKEELDQLSDLKERVKRIEDKLME